MLWTSRRLSCSTSPSPWGSWKTRTPKLAYRSFLAPSAALVRDLKERGMLDDTLVIWGGEFGRTPFGQGNPVNPQGRDHFGKAYSWWLAGGGIKPGTVYGATDDYAWNITSHPVHAHDMQATILHLCGIDHTKLTFHYQGRQYRLTDVHGRVVTGLLA
jgi:arylsulfatase A-like enzyme